MALRRSKHNLSHFKLLTGDMGFLYPIATVEVLPGDTFRHAAQTLIRMQPLLTPLLHPVHVSIRHFYVPNRIIWDGWEDFITGKRSATDNPIPTIANSPETDTLLDYMGIPPGAAENLYNALPLRGVNLIWNEWFRDQDIDTERQLDDTSVPRVRWEKDYMTTNRQYAQAGGALGEAASIIFNEDVPVKGIGGALGPQVTNIQVAESDQTNPTYQSAWSGTAPQSVHIERNPNAPDFYPNVRIPAGSTSGSVDINEWRRAMALQKYREHRNRFGSRHIDYLRYLGLTPSDGRLDRPEYLGGGRSLVSFSEVLQTVDGGDNGVPLGYQGGHGIASNRTNSYRRFFEENGYVHSFLFVRPRSMYSQAVNRTYLRREKDDYWQKENEMLGEQPTFTKELYEPESLSTIFGYQGRHQDYRYCSSSVTAGMRRSEYNAWHMSREFTQAPQLNSNFLECDPTKRIWPSSQDPQMYILAQHRIAARRLVSKMPRTF